MTIGTEPPRSLGQIPKARGHLPILGHAMPLLRDLPGVMRTLSSGPDRLQRLQIPGSYDIYLWSERESFDLLSNKASSSAHFVEMGEIITGYTAIINSDGAEHRRRRKAASYPFSPRGLTMTGVSALISEVIEDLARNRRSFGQ